jgi:hypothetical protein
MVLAAVLSALGVVILLIGSLVQVLDISMAVIASLLVVFAVIELRGPYPYLVYAVTSAVSLLVLPVKSAALIYLLFAGYYPIIKAALEGHLTRTLAWIIKLVVFNLVLGVTVLLAVLLVFSEIPPEWVKYWWLLLALEPVFLLYDVALTRLITVYVLRLRQRLRFLK